MAKKANELAEEIGQKCIKALEEGRAPWMKSFDAPQFSGLPMNARTDKRYRGINLINLSIAQIALGTDDGRWLTFKQAQAMGYKVRKGSKAEFLTIYSRQRVRYLRDDDGKILLDAKGNKRLETVKLDRPIATTAGVFHASQIDDMPPLDEKVYELDWDPIERAEELIVSSKAVIENNKRFNPPRYNLTDDTIGMPEKAQYPSAGAYYGDLLHELGHWTGHKKRLDRMLTGRSDTQNYAKEELRAEMASWMLSSELGLPHDASQHESYILHWVKLLKENPMELTYAAADAQKIQQWVLNKGWELKQEKQQEQDDMTATPADRQYLNVPYEDKDAAKELGAKWDKEAKAWYVPDDLDLADFSQWQVSETDIDLKKEAAPADPNATLGGRLYLNVPYEDKDAAKELGAKWDKEAKAWYVPDDKTTASFEQWLDNDRQEQHTTPQERFANAAASLGLKIEGLPVMNGQMQRVATVEDKPGRTSGAYVGYDDGVVAGFIQNWKSGETLKWADVDTKFDPATLLKLQNIAQKHQKEFADRRAVEQTATATKVVADLQSLPPANYLHPYFENHGGLSDQSASDVKIDDKNNLVVPLQDADGKVWSAQKIGQNGFKQFTKSGRVSGLHHFIRSNAHKRNDNVLVTTGYGTGVALHKATGMSVYCAMADHNLPEIARIAVKNHPREFEGVLICGDNDFHLKRNSGQESAEQASEISGARYVLADGAELNGVKQTDFADMKPEEIRRVIVSHMDQQKSNEHTKDVGQEHALSR